MEASGQPVGKALLGQALRCGSQINAGHTDLGESQLTGPPSQLRQQQRPIDLMLHAPILETRLLDWPDEAACAAWAAALARRPELRDALIELQGPLGAGKTTLVRHLLRALGVQGRIKSPTYAVVEPYSLPGFEISHFDFYRFDDPREWEDAGFRDIFARAGLKLAEWPDKVAGLVPAPDLRLVIEPVDEDRRSVSVMACTARGVALLR
jgi:tRNA threonylcarbamoyladenosine biosynthesis protein TsaE